MTDPVTIGPEGAPYLAVDVQPDDLAGVFTLDVSSLDEGDTLGWGATGWVNVVCDVLRVTGRQGATRLQGLLTQTEAAELVITVSDTEHQLDPLTNGENIHKGTPLRLRAWGYDELGDPWEAVLFTGEVDELGVTYSAVESPVVVITGVDLIAALAAWQSEGRADPGVGAGDSLLQRVDRVLDECGRGSIATADSDTSYAATLMNTVLDRPWQNITEAQEAELGRVWVDRANQLVVRGRNSALSGPVRGTLSDVHTDETSPPHCCLSGAVVVYGVELLTNVALGSRRTTDGSTAPLRRREDPYSVARYGQGTADRTGALELQTDAQVDAWAETLVLHGSRPELRVDRVQPAPAPDDLWSAVAAWPAVMSTAIGDRWLFRYHTQDGREVARTLGVLGVELDLSPDDWLVTWTTVDAPTPGLGGMGWFVLDASETDSGDLLAPYAQPIPA